MSREEEKLAKLDVALQAHQIEKIGKNVHNELKWQGNLLHKTNVNLDQFSNNLDTISVDLKTIQRNERSFCYKFFCCCKSYKSNQTNGQLNFSPATLEIFSVENHLTKQEIDKLWCKTYDPNERWLQQMDAHLDRLIDLADLIDINIGHQKDVAHSMQQKTNSTKHRMTKNWKKMDDIVHH